MPNMIKKNIQFNADKLQLFDHAVAKDGERTISFNLHLNVINLKSLLQ